MYIYLSSHSEGHKKSTSPLARDCGGSGGGVATEIIALDGTETKVSSLHNVAVVMSLSFG